MLYIWHFDTPWMTEIRPAIEHTPHNTGLAGKKFFLTPADGVQKVIWELPPASWTYYQLRNILQHFHFLNSAPESQTKLARTYLLSVKKK